MFHTYIRAVLQIYTLLIWISISQNSILKAVVNTANKQDADSLGNEIDYNFNFFYLTLNQFLFKVQYVFRMENITKSMALIKY